MLQSFLLGSTYQNRTKNKNQHKTLNPYGAEHLTWLHITTPKSHIKVIGITELNIN